ncbi:hypothetical protein [Sphingosinicella microcystinivorans]|uniref:Uncharacterized protein n=1 Tax=Sphingosinicella microcystinivorans TaxID=335406 RepID=A0AAD1D9H0_SPHMI|nr:hypothetical protein [Sphingosinicella microcystinivorans]RKS88072.1 hypothetical protein DFR51_2719 [Sphingosinicella microcystinivorans]BBE35883.1 hypothetical protein SmB9_35410 [Sphingosinicella microcystinivorans]
MIRSLGSAGLALVTLGTGLGLYLVSYSVGAERSGIAKLERQIATDRRDIRALEAELRVRSNLPQLERWNASALALNAPKAGQILESEVQLASLVRPHQPDALPADVRLANVELPAPAPAPREVQVASLEQAAKPRLPVLRERPDTGLFSASFVAEIDAAADDERASLTRVSLR